MHNQMHSLPCTYHIFNKHYRRLVFRCFAQDHLRERRAPVHLPVPAMLPLRHLYGKCPDPVSRRSCAFRLLFTFSFHSPLPSPPLQYSPALTAWVVYCIFVVVLIAALKVINLNMHGMYDRAQILSDPKASSGGVSHKTVVG